MIVTIDGPAGVGKTTLARELAQQRGFYLLPSGAVYRALAYAALAEGALDASGCLQPQFFPWLEQLNLEVAADRMLVQGQDISSQLQTPAIGAVVAPFSAAPQVRAWVNQRLRHLAAQHPKVVAEGRDMGSEVFPQAELKIFLYAELAVRVERCHGRSDNSAEICSDLSSRDQVDYQKKYGRLRPAEGSYHFDVSGLTFQQVYDRLVNLLETGTVTHGRSCDQKLGSL